MSPSYRIDATGNIEDPEWISNFEGQPTSGQWWNEYEALYAEEEELGQEEVQMLVQVPQVQEQEDEEHEQQEHDDTEGDSEHDYDRIFEEPIIMKKLTPRRWKRFVDRMFYKEDGVPPGMVYPVRPESIQQSVLLPSADMTLLTMKLDSGIYKIIEDTGYKKKCKLRPAYFLIRPSKYSQTYSFVYDTEGMRPRPVSARPLYILHGILELFTHATLIRLDPKGGAVSYRLSFSVNKAADTMELKCRTEDELFEVSLTTTETNQYLQVVKYELTEDGNITAPGILCAIGCGSRFVDNKCRQIPGLLIDTKRVDAELAYLLYFAGNYHKWAPKFLVPLIKPAGSRDPKVYKTVKYVDNVVDLNVKGDTDASAPLLAADRRLTLDGYKVIDDTIVVEDILTSYLIDYDFNEELYVGWEASAQRSMRMFNACTKRGTLPVDASRSRETRQMNWDLFDTRNK